MQKEVRIAALKAAKAKAEYLLQVIGEQLDKPLEIQEVARDSCFRSPAISNVLLSNSNMNSAGTNDESEAETAFSKIQVRFFYSVKYSIKQQTYKNVFDVKSCELPSAAGYTSEQHLAYLL